VTGEKQKAEGSMQKAESMNECASSSLPSAFYLLPTSSRGFTLLELMIVISIIVILAVVAMPQYHKTVTHARETVLRDDLFQIRKMIDQYAADKGKLPQSPEDLVNAGYIHEIPVDPMTSERNWQWDVGEDPGSAEGEQGIINVHSTSTDQSSEGTPYNEW